MLKRLRRKFIVIVMALVGVVLVAVLGSSFYSTYQTQHALVRDSLRMGLSNRDNRPSWEMRLTSGEELDELDELLDFYDDPEGELDETPGGWGLLAQEDVAEERRGGLFSLVMLLDEQGTITDINDAPVSMDADTLLTIIEGVTSGSAPEGYDTSSHVAWMSEEVSTGGTRLAIVDTTSIDALLSEQALHDIMIICVALLALFAISWALANWALKPVEEAWEQQRRFVSDASHELKTPLAVILANVQILQRDESIGDDARRWVDSTADEADHMKALVNDLLQLARADESVAGGAASIRHDDIDLSEMVEGSCLEFDAIAFERGCMLDSDVEQGIRITGDHEWMERLVRILIDNACKYGAAGTTVTVRLTSESGHTRLSVHNMGSPIDEQDLPHVFERFYRSDKARSREGEGGFGLGLAIAKGIAESHGGSISVTSSAEEGTTFTVTL